MWRRRRRHSQSGPAAAPQPCHHYPWRQLSSAHEKALGNVTVLAAVAQLERDIMDEKRRDGIAAARAKGVKFGRPRLVNDKLQTGALALKESGVTMPEIARRLKLAVSTTYRLLAVAKE
jgi:DNA invertase Pin-like site-specific DNA recombinase